jgi:hypothetical protein
MHSAETHSLAHVVCFEHTQSRRSFDESKEKSRLRRDEEPSRTSTGELCGSS